MNEERLESIETKLAYQEDLIEELNKTVYQQQKKLEQFGEYCRTLAGQIEALATASDGKVANERPPHY